MFNNLLLISIDSIPNICSVERKVNAQTMIHSFAELSTAQSHVKFKLVVQVYTKMMHSIYQYQSK